MSFRISRTFPCTRGLHEHSWNCLPRARRPNYSFDRASREIFQNCGSGPSLTSRHACRSDIYCQTVGADGTFQVCGEPSSGGYCSLCRFSWGPSSRPCDSMHKLNYYRPEGSHTRLCARSSTKPFHSPNIARRALRTRLLQFPLRVRAQRIDAST